MDLFVKNSGLQHIAVTVLKNLDPKSLENCRQVNEAWKHLIDTQFTQKNFTESVMTTNIYSIIGHNGSKCLKTSFPRKVWKN